MKLKRLWAVVLPRLVRPSWLTDEVVTMIEKAEANGWTVWHWPAGSPTGPGETALISGSYDAAGIRARWRDIQPGYGGENEPILGLDRLREISEANADVGLPDTAAQDSESTTDLNG